MKETLAPGQSIGSYRVVSAWDAGKPDEYFVAEAGEGEPKVMLKALPDAERLRERVAASARLEHPRIGGTLEIAEAEGRSYLVVKHFEGRSLAARMRKGISPPSEILATAIGLAEALEHAHDAGVIHGDVQPANVILTADGGLKLTAFGSLRKAAAGETGGRLIEYLSPEETRGQEPDERSDLYSLGVLLYEMAVGRRPFRARTPEETVTQIREAEPERIDKWHPGVPEAVVDAIHKCLAKDPAQRYGSAAELLADLRTQHSASHPASRRLRILIAASVVVAVAASVAVYWFLIRDRTPPPQSFALIGFDVPQDGGEPEYLGSGIAEGVVANLSRLRFGRVLSSVTVARARGRNSDIKGLGRTFEVEALVQGSIEKRGDLGIRLRVDLLEAATGRRRWTGAFDAGPGELHTLALRVSEGLAGWAGVPVEAEMREEMGRRFSGKPEALRFFFEGQALRGRPDLTSLRKSIEMFQKATASDPKFGLAHAALAEAMAQPVFAQAENKDRAVAAALRALSADDRLPEAHLALALVRFLHEWNWTDAEREFRRALQLNSGYLTASQWYAEFLAATDRLAGARAAIQEADQRDPYYLPTLWTSARISYFARRYDESLATARRMIQVAPGFDGGYQVQGSNLVAKNQASEAVAIVSRAGVLVPDGIAAPDLLVMLGCAYASAGHAEGFTQMIGQMRDMSSRRYVSAYHFATVYACGGDREEAYQWLNKAADERSPMLVYLNVEPVFNAIRGDARFGVLIRRMGLGAAPRPGPPTVVKPPVMPGLPGKR